MTKIEYYECDRCKAKIILKDIAMIVFIGKQKDLCLKCQDDLKIWLKEKKHG